MARRNRIEALKQPDFQAAFFDHFQNGRSGVRYKVRGDSNLPHDVVFLSALLHDARFNMSKVVANGRDMRVPLERDRWELYRASRKLEAISSRLKIGPVLGSRLAWEGVSPEKKTLIVLGIEALGLHAECENWTLRMIGSGWTWTLILPEFQFHVELIDEASPRAAARPSVRRTSGG